MNKQDPAIWTRMVILAIAPVVLVATILFGFYELASNKTRSEIEQFREIAKADAMKRSAEFLPPGSLIIVQPISPADSQRLRAMQETYQSQRFRRRFAGRFMTNGTILLVMLGGLWAFIGESDSAKRMKRVITSPYVWSLGILGGIFVLGGLGSILKSQPYLLGGWPWHVPIAAQQSIGAGLVMLAVAGYIAAQRAKKSLL